MKRLIIFAIAATISMTAQPLAAKPMLENYFQCRTNDGVTFADIVAFKNEYEAAVHEAGIEGYNLKVMFPVYDGKIGGGQFTWYGSFASHENWVEVIYWFRASEWPARFDEKMHCESSSLWQVDD